MRGLLLSLIWLTIFCIAVRFLFRPIVTRLPTLRTIYHRRVPILTTAIILIFCFAALVLPGTRSLLGNTFDLVAPEDIVSSSMLFFLLRVMLVSLTACLLGSVVMFTYQLVRLYGPKRFYGQDVVNLNPNITPLRRLIFLSLIAGPVVFGAIYKSIASSTLRVTSISKVP